MHRGTLLLHQLAFASALGPGEAGDPADPTSMNSSQPGGAEGPASAEPPPGGEVEASGREGPRAPAGAPVAATDAAPDGPEDPRFKRRGWTLRLGAGLGSCFRDICQEPQRGGGEKARLGFGSHLQFGYRPSPYVSLGGMMSFVFVPVDTSDGGPSAGVSVDRKARAFSIGGGAFADVHPLIRSRFDPFVGVGLGVMLNRATSEFSLSSTYYGYTYTSSYEIQASLTRGFFRIATGTDIFVTRRFALGPRFEALIPFAGRASYEITYAYSGGYYGYPYTADYSGPIDEVLGDAVDDTPIPWSAMLSGSLYF